MGKFEKKPASHASSARSTGTTGRRPAAAGGASRYSSTGENRRPSQARQNTRNPRRPGKKKKSPLPLILGVAAAIAVIVGCVIGFVVLKDDGKIVENLYVAGVDLSGMTREEARLALESQVRFDEHFTVDFYSPNQKSLLFTTSYDPQTDLPVDIFGKPVEPSVETVDVSWITDENGVPIGTEEPTEPEETPEPTEETEPQEPQGQKAPVNPDGTPMEHITTLTLLAKDLDIQLDLDQVVELAYKEGRSGGLFHRAAQNLHTERYDLDVSPYISINEEFIRKTLESMEKDTNVALTEAEVSEGTGTVTDPEGNEKEVTVLHITLGTPGREMDAKVLIDQIVKSLMKEEYTLQYTFQEDLPKPLDLDALYNKYCTPAVNAFCDEETYEITDGAQGFGFTKKQAYDLLTASRPGDAIELPLDVIEPQYTREILETKVFCDVLGSYDSWYVWNPPRTENLRLACAAIDGTILRPGDTFSFNDIVGERTAEKGYGPAPIYVGGRTEDSLGGGVCQVASTIYYSTLQAELEVVERYEHQYVPSYVPWGMDATIYWGSLDYKFRNNTPYPIRIDAYLEDGNVCIRLVGTETRDYKVALDFEILNTKPYEEKIIEIFPEMDHYDRYKGYKDGDTIQGAYTGYDVKTYRYHVDEDGNYIFSEVVNYSYYDKRDKEIAKLRDAEESTEDSSESSEPSEPSEPVEPPTTEEPPTDPPTEPSTETPPETSTEAVPENP